MVKPTSTGDLQPGQSFGTYVIQACIGRGGMARVYRAKHTGLAKTVALKVMDESQLENPKWRRRFIREGRAAAGVKHPHVVDVTDVGMENDTPYLVMEYLEGLDLSAHLQATGPLSERETVDLLLPIIAGLGFAHDAGIVHRDIKPSNIFLERRADGTTTPKLLDFGIAKANLAQLEEPADQTQTDTNQVLGTPLFLPPEALNGTSHVSARSDQYSLAVVIFQCLTGRSPFDQSTPASLLGAIAAGRHESLRRLRPGVSRLAQRVVERAMQIDAQKRFEHVRDMGRLLFPLASERTRILWEGTFGVEPRSRLAVARGLERWWRSTGPVIRIMTVAGVALAGLAVVVVPLQLRDLQDQQPRPGEGTVAALRANSNTWAPAPHPTSTQSPAPPALGPKTAPQLAAPDSGPLRGGRDTEEPLPARPAPPSPAPAPSPAARDSTSEVGAVRSPRTRRASDEGRTLRPLRSTPEARQTPRDSSSPAPEVLQEQRELRELFPTVEQKHNETMKPPAASRAPIPE